VRDESVTSLVAILVIPFSIERLHNRFTLIINDDNPMTTVINTPATTDGEGGGAGWAVAIIILLAVIGAGAYLWINYRQAAAPAAPPSGVDINVTLPENPVTNPTPTPTPTP
jgi:hypothetical protein